MLLDSREPSAPGCLLQCFTRLGEGLCSASSSFCRLSSIFCGECFSEGAGVRRVLFCTNLIANQINCLFFSFFAFLKPFFAGKNACGLRPTRFLLFCVFSIRIKNSVQKKDRTNRPKITNFWRKIVYFWRENRQQSIEMRKKCVLGNPKINQKNKRAQRFPKRAKGAKKVVQGEMRLSRGAASLRARATGKGKEGVNPSPGTGD